MDLSSDFFDVEIDSNSKLSKVHNFMYFHKQKNYLLEIHQYPNQEYIGYIEATSESNQSYLPCQTDSLNKCIQMLIDSVSLNKNQDQNLSQTI